MAGELPYGGKHLKIVKEAFSLLLRVREELRIVKLLENAIAYKELNQLNSAIEAHNSMKPPFYTPLVEQAKELVVKLEKEAAIRAGLLNAISTRNIALLNEFIIKANEMNISSVELQQAVVLKARIDNESELIRKLVVATKEKNFDLIDQLMSECIEMGLERVEMKQALEMKEKYITEISQRKAEEERQRKANEAAALKRQQKLEEAQQKLEEAKNTKSVAQINAALENALQLGLQTPEVAQTQILLSRFQNIDEARSKLMATIQVLQVKSESGIVSADLEALEKAIKSAEQIEAAEDEFSELSYAKDAYNMFSKHCEILVSIRAAMANKDRKALSEAIDAAENIDMSTDDVAKAKVILKELEVLHRADQSAGSNEQENYDAAEIARKKRQDLAKQAKFDIKHYPGLRSPDDFAKGSLLNKSKIKETFLLFQNYVIPKSLLDLNKEGNRLALQMHKDLLGYMGDKQMPFPAMLAQDILRKGSEYKPIRDEIYLQIIKQLSANPRAESVAKGWQMMCMCVGTFPPSYDFENYLLHYILEKRDRGRGAVVDYAKYCLRTLEAILSNGDGSGFVPSVDEILAYKDRPPILATIHLVDGNVITEDLPITPDLNVGKVLEMCTGWLDLRDPRINTLGVFVNDLGEIDDQKSGDNPFDNAPYSDLIRTPRPLRNEDYMGDVIVQKARQRRKFKFVLKKKIFLPQHNVRGDDPFYERLVYLQAEDEVIIQGNVDIPDEDTVADLAAISMAVAFGETMGSTVSELQANGVLDFIVPSWRDVKSINEWSNNLLQRKDFVNIDPEDLQEKFLSIVQESPQYGTHW
eukprot:CAMPEP_0196767886 /NCGR_PEP_ID=MMETSP1095-20130614/42077_1 /TAXON_ID=96789 ORGANISM="Chromulina nebulosa, Strain UTEXLB2642" /NCGR_SAMPLE_ID=MMETSP1095 /ASSEMBLY_ACC=CAM_ASM_000446 /LENGTH=814 /DNA_ID=CAMNT_0042136675 /DNA_START=2227 /DNA_END=4668 /DNA_ORIENTATION=-